MRKWNLHVIAVLTVVLLTSAILAQPQQRPPAPGVAPGARAGRRGGESPCFKQAGVSEATLQQIRGIHRSTHQEVVGICENTSLSPQQKRQQIQEARKKGEQQVHGLLTPQQQGAIKQCRQERRAGRQGKSGGMRGMRRGGGDPCARILGQQNRGQGEPPEGVEPEE